MGTNDCEGESMKVYPCKKCGHYHISQECPDKENIEQELDAFIDSELKNRKVNA